MNSEWNQTTLGEICARQNGSIQTGPFGSQLHTSDYKEFGTPVVMPTNIGDGGIDETGIARISQEDVNRLSQHVLKKGDIVFSRRGDVTKNALVRTRETGWFCGTGCLKVRVGDESIATAVFISQYLRLPSIKEWLVRHAVGATMPNLNTGILAAVPVTLPSLDEQKQIAKILDDFDHKIELNRQTNQTLEQIAQALFKSWFVDFEPTRAKIAAKEAGASPEEIERAAMCAISGKTPDQLVQLPPETQQNLKTTAALFPDVLVESELGEMPEGWEVKAMGHYLDTISKTYPLKTVDKVIFLNTGDIQNGQFLHAEYSEASSLPGQAKKSIQKNDILYSEIRPENKRFAFVNFDAPHHVVSTKLMVLRATKDISPLFLYFILTQQSTVDHLQMLAESRSGTFPQITFDHLSRIEFIAPFDNLLINKFVETVLEPSFQTQKMRDAENACLIELRDSLLPKLLSGEIQLKKNEEIINV